MVASAIVVFLVSSIIHVALKHHKADIRPLPGEGGVREALVKANPSPGGYFTPYCADHRQMNEPAIEEKFDTGPVAMLTGSPGATPRELCSTRSSTQC